MKENVLPSIGNLFLPACLLALCASCSRPSPVEKAEETKPVESTAFRLYVTNEVSGDMTIVDSATFNVIATVPLGKRPRGIHASPDRKTIYVALSGSPIAGPGVDEDTLPPAVSVAVKKGAIMAAMAARTGPPFHWSLSLLTGGLLQNGPEPSRARRYWARRSGPLTARTVLGPSERGKGCLLRA